MYIEEKIIKKYNLNIVLLSCIISSLIITIIHNIKFNTYIRDFIIPISIILINYIILINNQKIKANKKAYILLIPIILILLSRILLPISYSNMFLNILILPILISIFLSSLTNKNYTISRNILSRFFNLFPKGILNNLYYINIPEKLKFNNKKNKISSILLGLLIGLPIVIILLSLLTSGDKYFQAFINEILKLFGNILNIKFIIKNLILVGIWFTILFSVFINILLNKDKKEEKQLKIYNVIPDVATTILVLINLVFVLFLISEISKITTNFLQLPVEYTYSKYARDGFFQLLVVTTINFAIILYFLYYTNIIKNNKIIKYLILILVSFSIILVFNSYYRMFLYISSYSFTILRLQVILFLTMELLIFIILIKKIISKLKYQDSYIFFVILLVTYILNLYLCNNTIINLINKII